LSSSFGVRQPDRSRRHSSYCLYGRPAGLSRFDVYPRLHFQLGGWRQRRRARPASWTTCTRRRRSPGLKLGSHRPGAAVDPATEPRTATPQEEAELSAFAREWLPDDAGRLARTSVCLYENSPDGNFILDRHPDHANVLIFCGGSGHGFKFAPVIGEVLADLALEGQTAHAVGFLGIDRLQS
jgi:glycine/D-amino acid oxidase-like deaminating enzyme